MKRLSILFGALFLMVVLTACGQEGAKSGTVEVLEYDELIKKLDNEESFFLITTDATIEDVEKTNAIEIFEEELGSYDKGAYIVSLNNLSESEIKELEKDYRHQKQDLVEEGGGRVASWSPSSDGLVYVENGEVLYPVVHAGMISWQIVERAMDREDYFVTELVPMVEKVMSSLDDMGIETR